MKNFVVIIIILIIIIIFINKNNSEIIVEDNEVVPTETQIVLGKPIVVPDVPKDAIPPLDFPKYVRVDEVDFLGGNDLVIGVEINGDARAYPIRILNWHEIVNDNIGGQDVVITYCPLCKSSILFSRVLDDELLSFGNTGSLYESTLLMYDRETESLWGQVGGRAIRGKLKGKRLEMLPSTTTRWEDWRNLHTDTLVLSLDTGYRRNYESDPYATYDRVKDSLPPFPLSLVDRRLDLKELIIGVILNDVKKAYPIERLGWKIINDEVGNEDIVVITRPKLSSIFFSELDGEILEFEFVNNRIFDINTNSEWNFLGQAINGTLKGEKLRSAPIVYAFWFGWVVEYPDTLLYTE